MDIPKLKIFTNYVCPWCYLSQTRLKKIIINYNLRTQIIYFPFHPETHSEGRNLLDFFKCILVELSQRNMPMKKLIKEEKLNYNYIELTFNSHLAQKLGLWAEKKFKNSDIHDRLYEAYFD